MSAMSANMAAVSTNVHITAVAAVEMTAAMTTAEMTTAEMAAAEMTATAVTTAVTGKGLRPERQRPERENGSQCKERFAHPYGSLFLCFCISSFLRPVRRNVSTVDEPQMNLYHSSVSHFHNAAVIVSPTVRSR